MKARVGDRLVIEETRVGGPRRSGLVIAVRHEDGTPPYVVRWSDDDHESLVFPGFTARIEPSDTDLISPGGPVGG